MRGDFVAPLLLGLTLLAVAVLILYYVSNRILRRQRLARQAASARVEVGASTGVMTFLTPLVAAVLLGPILVQLVTAPAVISDAETTAWLIGLLAAGMLSMAGTGMHAAGRSIAAVVPADLPVAARRVVELYHRPLGHYPVHIGWSLTNAFLALLAAGHPLGGSGALAGPLIFAGAVQGLVRGASELDGRTAAHLLPLEASAAVAIGWRVAQLGADPIALYFVASLVATATGVAAWGILRRGFPPTSKPRSARDVLDLALHD